MELPEDVRGPGEPGTRGEARESSNPELRQSLARSISPAVWARHIPSGDDLWHAVSSLTAGQSVVTYCRGRWPAEDDAATSEAPPHDDRCEECSRQLIDVRRIQVALDELADFDLGGEA